MLHPILAQRKVFYPFLAGWFFLIVVHGGFLLHQTPVSASAAIIDSLVYNATLMILSLALYFPLAYPDEGDEHGDSGKPLWYHFIHHSATAVITLIIWLGSSFFLTGLFLEQNHAYMEFSRNSLPFRATIGALLMALLIVFYHFLGFYRHFEEKKSREEQLKKLVKEAELKALKAQLNPHFLFNSLNSISSLTISDPGGAREMLTQLSDFLRYSLRNNNESLLPLEDEIKNMNRYLEIEKVRFGEQLNTDFQIPADCYNWPVPAMILQPVYENAIKHGLYESIEPVFIRTSCSTRDDILLLSVINNFDPDCTPQKGNGVGLENVRNKLLLFYNRTDLISINRRDDHFEIRFMLPKIKNL
ncbi:MAG: sensor histidine kinase [Marinilabiliaceae bacterium]